MTCFYPQKCYARPGGGITFSRIVGYSDVTLTIPCGSCIGCRLEKSRQWGVRCVNEIQMHEENIFITLTYSPDHLPEDHSVNLRDFQLFMKRLRKQSKKKYDIFIAANMATSFNALIIMHLSLATDFQMKPISKQQTMEIISTHLKFWTISGNSANAQLELPISKQHAISAATLLKKEQEKIVSSIMPISILKQVSSSNYTLNICPPQKNPESAFLGSKNISRTSTHLTKSSLTACPLPRPRITTAY